MTTDGAASKIAAIIIGLVAPTALAQSVPVLAEIKRDTGMPATIVSAPPASREDSVRALLVPSQETTLASPIMARIEQLNVTLGSNFSAGQVLVQFNCDEPTARMNMAKAELAGAVESHEAKVRMQGMQQASDVEVAVAASVVVKLQAEVSLYAAQIKNCKVVAPWAGRVAKVHVKNHMSVTPAQPMIDLIMAAPLKVKMNAPSNSLASLRLGQIFPFHVDETGREYQARISTINSRIDAVSQTIEIEAHILRHYPELLAGMSGIAKIGKPR